MAVETGLLSDESFATTRVDQSSKPGPTQADCPRCGKGKLAFIGRYWGPVQIGTGWGAKTTMGWVFKFLCQNNECGVELDHKGRK